MSQLPLVIVNRNEFSLEIHEWLANERKFARAIKYLIATGVVGRATPGGPYYVSSKNHEPTWFAPAWAEGVGGQQIPFSDPRNPFAGGFIGLSGNPSKKGLGIGFHGTRFDPKLGTRASHGCVRMATEDFLDLYDRVPVGTLVYVV